MKWRAWVAGHRDRLAELREKEPHERLGVTSDASAIEIRRAYRSKALAYHPDRVHPFLRAHCGEVMRLLNAAYEELLARRPE